jgi:hypothetical protein
MALDKLRLTLTTEGYDYLIYPLRGVDERQTKSAFSLSPPGRAASENILLGIQGQQADLTVNFRLHNDGTDKANGTAPAGEFANDTVITIAEQRDWVNNYIHDEDTFSDHTLTHITGDEFDEDDMYVSKTSLPTLQQDSPKWHKASISLRRGGGI